jgi:hypothetical protein
MALLLIILAMFAFLGFGSGSGSTGTSTSHAEPQRAPRLTVADCIEVAWEAGRPVHKRPCPKAPAKP